MRERSFLPQANHCAKEALRENRVLDYFMPLSNFRPAPLQVSLAQSLTSVITSHNST